MSSTPNAVSTQADPQKELMRYLLEQVKERRLEKSQALGFLKYLEASSKAAQDDIAIIGLACKFPEADNKEAYWKNLAKGRSSIRPFPANRKADFDALGDPEAPLFNGGFLDDIHQFDNEYFNIPPAVANHMDPYHRLLLESFIETIEDAGYSRSDVQGRKIGVYTGNDHTHRLFNSYLSFIDEPDFNSITGSWTGVLASRIAYLLNLQGPAMVVDTSCSSALVAIDIAAKALRDGDCEAALVGAANLFFAPGKGIVGDVENDDFVVRTFDQGASGTVWGEGVASLLLKPLKAALKDGDSIYGVIQGVAVNNDGASNGITAPSARAQEKVLNKAWERAGINPEQLSYIESHGTGTHLGDPIEIRGISNAMAKHTNRRQFCGIGSVKTNIGHTVGTAGLASLVKVLLSYQYNQLPPSLNFDAPNPLIDFCGSPVYVNDRLADWPAQQNSPRYAGISSFSLSGTNCHIVLRDHDDVRELPAERPMLFVLSARNPELLLASLHEYLAFIDTHQPNFAHLCFTAAAGRDHQDVRLAIQGNSLKSLRAKLQAVAVCINLAGFEQSDFGQIDGDCWYSVARNNPAESLAALDKSANNLVRENTLNVWQALAPLYVAGARIDWKALFSVEEAKRVHLPAKPWVHKSFWMTPTRQIQHAAQENAEQNLQQIIADIVAQPCRVDGVQTDVSESANEKIIAWALAETLGYDSLKAGNDYYALGGDSILGARIVHMANEALGTDIQIAQLMAASCIGDFIREAAAGSACDSREGDEIPRIESAEHYPLSRAQERMFILNGLVEDPCTYNVNAVLEIDELPELEQTHAVLSQLLNRHEILRTGFKVVDGEARQFVQESSHVNAKIDIYTLPSIVNDEAISHWLTQAIRPFDLAKPPLMRISFAVTPDQGRCFMAIDMHHIATDGASMGVLIGEYLRLVAGDILAPMGIQYKDFAFWHNALLESESFEKHANYWYDRFQEAVPEAALPLDYPRPTIQKFQGARWHQQMPCNVLDQAKAFAAEQGISLFMLLNAVFRILMFKYDVGRDLVLGSPVTGRNHSQLHGLIGMFVNTLAFRFELQPQEQVNELLSRLKTNMLADFSHQDYPFEALVERLDLQRDTSRNPLFDIYFVLQNEDMGLTGEGIKVLPYDTGTAKFDLTLVMREARHEQGVSLDVDWEYATSIFKKSTVQRLANHFQALLQSVCKQPNTRIADIPILSSEERTFLLNELNSNQTGYPAALSLNAQFERHVAAQPNALALRSISGSSQADFSFIEYSYAELNARANQLAQYLLEQGVKPGDVAGLYLPRSADMVISILATLKAGATYVPLDSDNPAARLLDILDDAEAVCLITHSCMPVLEGNAVQAFIIPILVVDQLDFSAYSQENLPALANGGSIAYLMYTSGTTGRPKGARIRHKSISRVVVDTNYLHLDSRDICMQVSSFAFDGCVPDLFGALLNGGLLVLPDKSLTLDLPVFGELIEAQKITSMFVTTSLFNVMVDTILDRLVGLKNIIFGGEAGSYTHVKKALAKLGPGKLINGYGPTETTVFAVAHVVHALDEKLAVVPIGTPLSNTYAYVLNATMELLPVGATGELYIGGDGVALGYLKREALTAERFVANPFVEGDTLYRTGDLVKRLEDNTLVYVSRRDMQVKIRGFRIELEEIRTCITQYDGVVDAAVSAEADDSGVRQLLAWVVTPDPENFDIAELKAWLHARLPDYMVPVALLPLAVLPLNINGKLDRKQLPMPNLTSAECVNARNNTEQEVLNSWKEVLHQETISVHDNFFSLGGDSIKGIRLVARLQQAGLVSNISQLFQHPTVAALAAAIEESGGAVQQMDQSPVTGELVLNPIQRWFFAHHHDDINHFNHVMWVQVDVLPSVESLQQALQQLVTHHDALRTRFKKRGANWRAEIAEPGAQYFTLAEFSAETWQPGATTTDAELLKLQRGISIADGVNIAVGLMKASRGPSAICVAAHHLVVDVVSWPILLEDLQHCLEGKNLPPKTRSFSDWNRELESLAESKAVLASRPYWESVAKTEVRYLCNAVHNAILAECDIHTQRLDTQLTANLLESANKAFTTDPIHLLLCALALTCDRWIKPGQTLIQLEGHGRYPLDEKSQNTYLERTVGWFTCVYPHVLPSVGDLASAIKEVKESMRNVPGQGRDFGLLNISSRAAGNELLEFFSNIRPEIGFNFLGSSENASKQVLVLPRSISCSPKTPQPLLLDIVVSVRSGQLEFEVLFDAKRLTLKSVDDFMQHYQNALQEICDFCLCKDGCERTASDFSGGIAQSELNDIFDDLELV